ncbi:hypothetical protein [Nocardioides sp.]|uniref:hypothetical protein n=1 Tax=Nocardioides sp. TaxID=35761 RepID=UPI0035276B10
MARRVSMPTADDLFRPTDPTEPTTTPRTSSRVRAVPDPDDRPSGPPRPSGRVRHDEKMTVYVTAAELLHLEQARLQLRAVHGLAVDRGRLVREALALVLAEFEDAGEESALVRRLTEE